MSKVRIAITGATSFTGFWIGDTLRKNNNYEIFGLTGSSDAGSDGLKKYRSTRAKESFRLFEGIRSETGEMARWILEFRPDLWIHHHHFMSNFRSPEYDLVESNKVGIEPLPEIIESLKKVQCRGIIYSGSVFEPAEGKDWGSLEPTPYAKSKAQVWSLLVKLAENESIPISKVVIANPIGPFENEDRLVPVMIRLAKNKLPLQLRTPRDESDNLPVFDLANVYVQACTDLLSARSKIYRPSGWVCSNLEFIEKVNEELIEKRLGLNKCHIDILSQLPKTKGTAKNNSDEKISIDFKIFWDRYSEEIRQFNSI